jgi:hypothetical protein
MLLKLAFAAVFILPPKIAFSAETDWSAYVKSKGKECSLTVDELNVQIDSQIDLFAQRIGGELAKRGSSATEVEAPHDQVDIGIFPKLADVDFWVNSKIVVKMDKFGFPVQTTLATGDPTPVVKQGLWFPLVVKDTGKDKTCELEPITVDPDQKKFLPVVDMVMGDPARVIARDLVQVANIKGEPATAPYAVPVPEQRKTFREESAPKADGSDVGESRKDERGERREKKRERRHRRHREREHRRRHYRRHRVDVPALAEPPQKGDECSSPDKSVWKTITCAAQGK